MSDSDASPSRREQEGATTGVEGTPFAVDVSRDRKARGTWLVFLAGPLLWISHFAVVYLVSEAGCTGGGPGLRVFDPPVPTIVTLFATAAAAIACVPFALRAHREWRTSMQGAERHPRGDVSRDVLDARASLSFAGFLLTSLFFVAILFDGIPAAFLSC